MDSFEGRQPESITLHKYLYAHSDPVNGTDPAGLFTLSEILNGKVIAAALTTLATTVVCRNVADNFDGSELPPEQQRILNAAIERIRSVNGGKYNYIADRAEKIRWKSSNNPKAYAETKFTYRLVVLNDLSFELGVDLLSTIVVHEVTHSLQKISFLRGLKTKYVAYGEWGAYNTQNQYMLDAGISGNILSLKRRYNTPEARDYLDQQVFFFESLAIENPAIHFKIEE